MSKADFVKSIRSPKTPRRFLASLTKYFLSDDPEDKSIFELDLMEAAIKLEQKKPSYGKRKLLNNALVPAIFSLIKREVEASNKEAVKTKYVEVFRDQDFVFDLVVQELDKVDELMEEMQTLTEEERRKVTRKPSVVDDDLTTSQRIEKVLDVLANETPLEKSKCAKIFREKNHITTFAVRKGPIKQKLGAKLDFPSPDFSSGGKYFTKEDSTTAVGGASCGSFQCSIVKLHILHPVLRQRILDEIGSTQPGDPIIYDGEVEDEEAAKLENIRLDEDGISRDFPTLSQGQAIAVKKCSFCEKEFTSKTDLMQHIKENHPKCNVCREQFNSHEELHNHSQMHIRIQCSKCKRMIKKEDLANHKEEHKIAEGFKKAVNKEKIKKKGEAKTVNPWLAFRKAERPRIKADHPLYTSSQINMELSRRWKELSVEEKEAFRAVAEDEPDQTEEADPDDEVFQVESGETGEDNQEVEVEPGDRDQEEIIEVEGGRIGEGNEEEEEGHEGHGDGNQNVGEVEDEICLEEVNGGERNAKRRRLDTDLLCPLCNHHAESKDDYKRHRLTHRQRQVKDKKANKS